MNVDECIDVFIDEPGDHTIRPMSPKRIAQVKAERDRVRQIEAENKRRGEGEGKRARLMNVVSRRIPLKIISAVLTSRRKGFPPWVEFARDFKVGS